MKLRYYFSIGNYGEGHDNLLKFIMSFLKCSYKLIRIKIYIRRNYDV